MIKEIKKYKILTIITLILSLFNLLFYFSMRCIWTGIDKVIGLASNPPLWFHDVLFILFLLVFVATLFFGILKKEKIPMYILFVLSILLFLGIVIIVYKGAIDYLIFILREFLDACIVVALIFLFTWIVFFYPKSNIANSNKLKIIIISILIFITIISTLGLGINYFTYKPVVYAVEDNYQIVFSSSMD